MNARYTGRVAQVKVTTASSSVYELRDGWITRISTAGGTTNGVPVDHLRKDGEAIKVLRMEPPIIGHPWELLLQIREDGVPTVRMTTPVVAIEE